MRIALVLLLIIAPFICIAQNDCCEAVLAILRDAPNEFRNVRTNLLQTDLSYKAYRSGIHVPGAIQERFVASRGLFYEGAMAQSLNPESMRGKYDSLVNALDSCLKPLHFNRSNQPLFDPRLKNYKKIAFLPAYTADTDIRKLKGHIAVEIDYNKSNGAFTIELFIYQH